MNQFSIKKHESKSPKLDDPLKTLFHLGGTMVVDKGFDIKNYLNILESRKNKNSRKLNILNSTSQFSTFNSNLKPEKFIYNAYLTSTFDNKSSNKKFKKNIASFSTNLAKKNYINTSSSNNLDYKKTNKTDSNSYYNFLSTKNSTNLLYNKINYKSRNSPTHVNENFNVFKAIKEIKKSSQKPTIINIKKSPNKKLFLTKIPNIYKNNPRAPLAYSREYVDTVFDSKKVLNNYNFRKGLELDIPDDLNTFSSKKKEISVNNVLIKLLNKESEKLYKKEKDFKARNENNKNIIETDIRDFEEYTDGHKIVCKGLENCLEKLKKENNNLINELIIYKSLNKNNMDEIQKLLEQIETLRGFALFVHQSLEKDTSRYEKSIFPDYRTEKLEDYDKKIEKIRNFVIKNYSIFWDNKYKEEVREELEFLEDPDIMIQKFNEIEGNIVRLLDLKDNLYKEMEEDAKNHKIILEDLESRLDEVEKEYKMYEKNIKMETSQISSLKRKETDYNSEYISLIGNLFLNIVEVFGKNDKLRFNYKSLLNGKIDKDNIDICLREGERLLREKEDLLNNTLLAIKSYQQNDKRFFTQVMDISKQKNKLQKHLLHKKNNLDQQIENEAKVNNKNNKIVLISRKTEPPYHSPQKKVKNVINYDLIKRLEDEELLKYD